MKPQSVKQLKQLLDARDLLRSAHEQYETSIGTLKGALDFADSAMVEHRDEEVAQQIKAMRELVASLPRAPFETIEVIAGTLEAMAHEVTADEEHLPAGVS